MYASFRVVLDIVFYLKTQVAQDTAQGFAE